LIGKCFFDERIINNVCSLDPKNRDFQQNNNLKSNLRSDLPYIDFEYLNQYSNQWDKDSNLKDLKIVEQSRNGKSLYIELNSYYYPNLKDLLKGLMIPQAEIRSITK